MKDKTEDFYFNRQIGFFDDSRVAFHHTGIRINSKLNKVIKLPMLFNFPG